MWWLIVTAAVSVPLVALGWIWMLLRLRERRALQQRYYDYYRPTEAQIRWAKADMPDLSDYHDRS